MIGKSVVAAALLLTGCAQFGTQFGGLFNDLRIEKALAEGRLRLGMNEREVALAIEHEPLARCQKGRVTERGTVVLWDLTSRSNCGENMRRSYALIFTNGKLSEIRTVQNALDLQLQ